jgi:hypothetical protein
MCGDLWLLDTDFVEHFGKSAAHLAAHDGKDLGEPSDRSLGGRGRKCQSPDPTPREPVSHRA